MLNNIVKKRYVQGKVSIYKIALSIDSNTFLSHYTALYLHNLTDNIIKDVYTNKELTRKTVRVNKLIQENIDRAFSHPMRVSRQVASSGEYKIFLLNSKNFERNSISIFAKPFRPCSASWPCWLPLLLPASPPTAKRRKRPSRASSCV